MNIIPNAIRNLLGGLNELRTYSQQEAIQLTAEAKQLEASVAPTVQALQAERLAIRSKADMYVEQLKTVSVNAEAMTDVAVAAADTAETLAANSERYQEAMQRIESVAGAVAPNYLAMLQGKKPSPPEVRGQSAFFQLPGR